MNASEWDQLSELLVKVADLEFPTWQEKREHTERNLSKSAFLALTEISAWGWE